MMESLRSTRNITHSTRRLAALVALALLLALAVSVAGAQEGEGGITVTLDPDAPAIQHGEPDSWDDRFTDGGAFFYHDGQFHMFRNGFRQWPGLIGIAYHTSPDGLSWEQVSDGPLFMSDVVPFGQQSALASSVVVEDDGTWVMYFYTVGNQFSDSPSAWAIGRATAPEALGPWTIDPEPVLLPGDSGEWDAARVSFPSVVKTGDGYMMWFEGYDEAGGPNIGGTRQIGLATSADGITWTKYDDPATTDAPYAASDPVLTPGGADAWDAAWVGAPSVAATPDGYVMSYKSASPAGNRDQAFGLATSADGITWTRVGDAPVLSDQMVTRRHMWWHGLTYAEDTYYFGAEIQRGYQNETDIYTGTLDGDPFAP